MGIIKVLGDLSRVLVRPKTTARFVFYLGRLALPTASYIMNSEP